MADTKVEIIETISTHIRNRGGKLKYWYVGVAEDAKERLFGGHNVNKNTDRWIYRTDKSSKEARQVEKFFIKLGTGGGPAGGDEEADKVYAYLKSDNTKPLANR